jgi:hypothetical protein
MSYIADSAAVTAAPFDINTAAADIRAAAASAPTLAPGACVMCCAVLCVVSYCAQERHPQYVLMHADVLPHIARVLLVVSVDGVARRRWHAVAQCALARTCCGCVCYAVTRAHRARSSRATPPSSPRSRRCSRCARVCCKHVCRVAIIIVAYSGRRTVLVVAQAASAHRGRDRVRGGRGDARVSERIHRAPGVACVRVWSRVYCV